MPIPYSDKTEIRDIDIEKLQNHFIVGKQNNDTIAFENDEIRFVVNSSNKLCVNLKYKNNTYNGEV